MYVRITLLLSLMCALVAVPVAHAQGNISDFSKPGPATERLAYYAQVRTEINETLAKWQQAWERNDAAALSAFYAQNATYLPAAASAAASRAAIRDHFAQFLPDAANLQVQMIDFGTSGDIAYMAGRFTYWLYTPAGGSRYVVSTEIVVLRRRSVNQWEIEMHMSREEPDAN